LPIGIKLAIFRNTGNAFSQPVLEIIKSALNKRRNRNVNTNMWNKQNDADEDDTRQGIYALHPEA
jgi:hypothetical protein